MIEDERFLVGGQSIQFANRTIADRLLHCWSGFFSGQRPMELMADELIKLAEINTSAGGTR